MAHLQVSRGKFDITEIYDRQGYSPLHFAAYKNQEKMCEALCEFLLTIDQWYDKELAIGANSSFNRS